MTVPGTCESCRHWRRDDYLADIYNGPIGSCMKIEDSGFDDTALAYAGAYDGGSFRTRPTFGCVLWEST